MKKKLLIGTLLSMALMMCLLFAGCSGSEDADSEQAETTAAAAEETNLDLAAGITRTDNEETGESTVESEVFTLTLPDGSTWDYEVVSPEEITFYNKAAKEGDFGGTLFTLQVFEPDDESYDVMPSAVVGEKDGKKIVAVFTSDVEYDFDDETAKEEYLKVYDVVQTISDDASASPLVLK